MRSKLKWIKKWIEFTVRREIREGTEVRGAAERFSMRLANGLCKDIYCSKCDLIYLMCISRWDYVGLYRLREVFTVLHCLTELPEQLSSYLWRHSLFWMAKEICLKEVKKNIKIKKKIKNLNIHSLKKSNLEMHHKIGSSFLSKHRSVSKNTDTPVLNR